jgi:hypothetical protein
MAVLAGKLEARRQGCAPVAGKSTLNRLELSCLEPTRYHKISHNPVAIKGLFVDLFLEAHDRAPNEIILDLDATDDPVHGEQEGRFFHGYYDCYCYLPLYIFCGRHLLASKLRRANLDAADGAVKEVARIVAQIRSQWPNVRILLRGDSGFARDELMAWGEANDVGYVFGLAKMTGSLRRSRTSSIELKQRAAGLANQRGALRISSGERLRVGAASAVSLLRPSGRRAKPILGLSSPPSSDRSAGRHDTFTKKSTALAVRWRIASKSVSSISMPTVPRQQRCKPISCGCGLLRWPTSCSAPCGASDCLTHGLNAPPVVQFASSFSKLEPSFASVSVESKSL